MVQRGDIVGIKETHAQVCTFLRADIAEGIEGRHRVAIVSGVDETFAYVYVLQPYYAHQHQQP